MCPICPFWSDCRFGPRCKSHPQYGTRNMVIGALDVTLKKLINDKNSSYLDKPARLTIRILWFLFLIVRRVPRPSESGCKKCNGLKKYLLGHTFSWKRLSAILCPWNPPWWWFFSLKLNKKCLKTPSKIKGLSFISSNLGNMDFFLIFNCISH